MELHQKTALVTGAGTRLGQQMAIHLAKQGMNVAIHYHSSKEGALKTQSLCPDPQKAQIFSADLSQQSSIQALIHQVQEQYGTIAVLINNAADFYPTPIGTVTEEQWDHLFNLNLKAAFFLAQEVSSPMLERQEGKIINLADVSASRPWKSFIPYCMTKAGIVSMTQGLAKALAPHIHVNAIAPGTVLPPHDGSEIDIAQSVEQSLLKRMGSAEDIVRALAYLLESDFVTGTVLEVDGGRRLAP